MDTPSYSSLAKPAEPEPPRRMRIRRGRVMHVVEPAASGWLRSKCRREAPLRGVNATVPRAEGYVEDWTDERYWYPDCRQCPTNETKETNT